MLAEPCPISGYPLIRKNGVVYSVALDMEVKRTTKVQDVKVESKKSDNPRMKLFERRVIELERKGWTRVLDSGNDVPLMIDPTGNKFNLETGQYVNKDNDDDSWLQNLTSGRLRKKIEKNTTASTQKKSSKLTEKRKSDSEISPLESLLR